MCPILFSKSLISEPKQMFTLAGGKDNGQDGQWAVHWSLKEILILQWPTSNCLWWTEHGLLQCPSPKLPGGGGKLNTVPKTTSFDLSGKSTSRLFPLGGAIGDGVRYLWCKPAYLPRMYRRNQTTGDSFCTPSSEALSASTLPKTSLSRLCKGSCSVLLQPVSEAFLLPSSCFSGVFVASLSHSALHQPIPSKTPLPTCRLSCAFVLAGDHCYFYKGA